MPRLGKAAFLVDYAATTVPEDDLRNTYCPAKKSKSKSENATHQLALIPLQIGSRKAQKIMWIFIMHALTMRPALHMLPE